MSRLFLTTAFAGLFAATASFAARDMVKDVDVQVDLTAIANPAAAQRYSTISDDLKNAILARLSDRLSDEGVKITVDVSEVELSNSFTELTGGAETKLVGVVSFTDENDNSNYKSFTLSVDVNQALPFIPAGFDVATLTAGSQEYYNALIAAFADNVAANMVE